MKIIQLCNTSLWLRCSKITDWSLSFQTGIISISVYYINDNNFICTFMILILRMHNILSISKECIKDMIKLTRGPTGHISCTWVQCATSLTERPRPPFLYDPKTQIWYIKTLRSCFLSSFVEFCSAVSEKSKLFQPIRGQGGHLVFPIGLKNTNLEEDVVILFPVMFRWIPFSSFSGEVENVSANQRPGRPPCFSDQPEKHKLVEGVVILLPVKFRWIPFSGFRGEVQNVSANQRQGRPSCFSNRPEKHKLGRRIVNLLTVMFRWIPFSGFRGEVENVSANQRQVRRSCFPHRPEKQKLGRERCNLASCQVSLNSVQRFQRRSRKCFGQSEARAAILFFRLARKTQTW